MKKLSIKEILIKNLSKSSIDSLCVLKFIILLFMDCIKSKVDVELSVLIQYWGEKIYDMANSFLHKICITFNSLKKTQILSRRC